MFQIITFYKFKRFEPDSVTRLKTELRELMKRYLMTGTIILAAEGFNATVCGEESHVEQFVAEAENLLQTTLVLKSSFHEESPFRKIDVKVKPEIVTLKKDVDISKGVGTHVEAAQWNELISDPSVVVLDTRNDYEFRNGTFAGAINPGTEKFSELPQFVEANLDPEKHPTVAMFCTGGIRCEKFAPYMKELGFKNVYQLSGGILRYLEEVPEEESLWRGECFIFDDRRTLDKDLRKGTGPDYSQKEHRGTDE